MLLKFIRYLRAQPPNDKVLGPWIDNIRSGTPGERGPNARPGSREREEEASDHPGDNGLHN